MQLQSPNSKAESNYQETIPYHYGQEIQSFGSLRNLPDALPGLVRAESCELLNQILADSHTLYSLYKKHYWLIRDCTFYQLHLLLDKHAIEQLKLIDLLGKRVQELGGIAIADPRHIAEVTKIERPPNGMEEASVMLSRLVDAHKLIVGEVREAIDRVSTNWDNETKDLLTHEVLQIHELQVGFLKEHLTATSSPNS